jgi:hypothetical protein
MDSKIDGACQFCILVDMRNKNIFDRLQEAYGEKCVSCVWVGKRTKTFREGHPSLADDLRSGRHPISDGVERIPAKIECEPYQYDLVTAQDPGLFNTYILEILRKVLKLKKILITLRSAHSQQRSKKLPGLKWQPQY